MSAREHIPRLPIRQPSRPQIEARNLTELAKQVHELSGHLSADERPQLSSHLIETQPDGTPVALVSKNSDGTYRINGVVHGLGRPYRGWHLASKKGPADVWETSAADIAAAKIDTGVYLPLECDQDVNTAVVVF